MYVYQDPTEGLRKARMHPFIAVRPGEAGFVDFKSHPERIPEALEDFVAHAHEPAVQTFYHFLAWLNGHDSFLESCDCALRGPESHRFKYSKRKLCAHGRLMLMHRDLAANCDDRFNLLYNALGRSLTSIDPEFLRVHGLVGLAPSRALFEDLLPAHANVDGYVSRFGDAGRGYQVTLVFKAFGNDAGETFANLDRVFKNIEAACRGTSKCLQALKTE